MKTAGFTWNQPSMIYVVLRQPTWTIGEYLIDGITNNKGVLFQTATTPGLKMFAGIASGQDDNLVLNTFGIVRMIFDGASSKLIVNENTPVTGDFGATNLGGLTIGAQGDGGGSYSNGEYKKIIGRNIIDTEPNQQVIYDYLTTKYGL